ncbi:putative TIM-barrel fold metal-dependent hydrolase [Paraburkholderia sp. RAU6.4a]|uniref:amidohydrolase family protein n=1 Tax=Paraburkholderia sp. RAU6.4a TaxID=2991067 RepID=UPI003D20E1F9
MLDLCQPPLSFIRKPAFALPAGATDCHVHVYGPNANYAVAPTRAFDAPEALPATLASVLDAMGVERVVLVQPSGYGLDNLRHLDAIKEVGRPARMIASLRADTPDSTLKEMNELGVRGVRYTIGHAGAAPLSEMPSLARRIADFGWHIQLHVMSDGGGSPLTEMEQVLLELPTDVVIDHLGSLRPERGLSQPGFETLMRLVDAGKCWVKLSGAYRVSATPPYVDMVPFVAQLLSMRADRLVWASDWPHVAFKGIMPNTTDLLDQLLTWIPDEAQRNTVLVDNPAKLYGF